MTSDSDNFSKLDTHVHTKYSGMSSEWFLRKMGCPESFTEPEQVYEIAKKNGMQFVTITDHNTIDGVLKIAHLPDVIVGCEVATVFPDSGAKIDVVTLGIDEDKFRECMKLRDNVFDLVAYLNREGIFHALAHPLYRMSKAFDREHFEKCLLLFKNMEVINGTRTKSQNVTTMRVLEHLDREVIERLANEHDIEPYGPEPWKKNCTAGSDDHGGLLIGANWTEVPRVATPLEFFRAVGEGRSKAMGSIGTAHTMAHNIYRAAYKYIVDIMGAYEPPKGDPIHYMVMKLLFDDESSRPKPLDVIKRKVKKKLRRSAEDSSPGQILTLIKEEAKKLIKMKPQYRELLDKPLPTDKDELNRAVFSFMSELGNLVIARISNDMLAAIREVKVARIMELVPALGTAHFFLLPYYVSYGVTNRSNQLIDDVSEAFLPDEQRFRAQRRVAMFTDTFDEVNGVAVVVKQMLEEAGRAGVDMLVVKAGEGENRRDGNLVHFQSVAEIGMPEYPEIKLRFPSLLDVLDWCEHEEFTSIHAATPGTMGLIALLASKILHVPFLGTYHTEITDYARYLTDSESVAKAASKFICWFYEKMDVIFAPSEAARRNLAAHGVNRDLVHFIPWGVDTNLFTPEKGDPAVWAPYDGQGRIKLLYAGRISKEKDLDILAEAFIGLCAERDDLLLALAGGGPFRDELERMLRGYPAVFLGYLDHRQLARFYASADVFVFPSTTDTFGNVVLEAHASGLPVIVSDKGGPKENVRHGETGLITPGRDSAAFKQAIRALAGDAELRRKMRRAARPSVLGKSAQASFAKYWDLHK